MTALKTMEAVCEDLAREAVPLMVGTSRRRFGMTTSSKNYTEDTQTYKIYVQEVTVKLIFTHGIQAYSVFTFFGCLGILRVVDFGSVFIGI